MFPTNCVILGKTLSLPEPRYLHYETQMIIPAFISLGMIKNYLGKKCFLNARMILELLSKSFEVFLSAQFPILGSAHI